MGTHISYLVNYGLSVVMMCQCRSINCNQCTTLVRAVGNEESNACVGMGGIREISVLSS